MNIVPLFKAKLKSRSLPWTRGAVLCIS